MDALGARSTLFCQLISLKRWCEQRTIAHGVAKTHQSRIRFTYLTLCGSLSLFAEYFIGSRIFPQLGFSRHIHLCKPLYYMASMVKYSTSTRATRVQILDCKKNYSLIARMDITLVKSLHSISTKYKIIMKRGEAQRRRGVGGRAALCFAS